MNIEELQNAILPAIQQHQEKKGYWLLRTEAGTYYESFKEYGYVGIKHKDLAPTSLTAMNLDNVSIIERNARVRSIVEQNYIHKENIAHIDLLSPEQKRDISVRASQIAKFTWEMKKGDYVLIPSENSEEISIGVLNGVGFSVNDNYDQNLLLTKSVEWKKSIKRSRLDPCLYPVFNAHQAICDIKGKSEYILRNVSSQFVLGDKIHFVITINSQNISARSLFRFGNGLIDLFEDYLRYANIEIDSSELEISTFLNSPGKLDFKSTLLNGALFSIVIVSVLGGSFRCPMFNFESNGIRPIIESIHDYKHNNDKVEHLKQQNDSLVQNLSVESVEEWNGTIDDENANNN